MYVYDAESGQELPLSSALSKMTPAWVERGWNCQQTTIDLIENCRLLLSKNAALRKITGAGDSAIAQLEHAVSVLESENNELREQLATALSTAEQLMQQSEDLRQERLQA